MSKVVDATGHIDIAKAKAAGVVGVIRYIGGPFPSGKQTDRAELDGYRRAGLKVAACYETSVNQMTGGYSAGAHDAKVAQGFLAGLGFPADAVIYFANDHESTSGVREYVKGAASVLGKRADGKSRVGVYAGLDGINLALSTGLVDFAWQTYAWSRHQWAMDKRVVLYQHNEDGHSWGEFGQDVQDEARSEDWGQERNIGGIMGAGAAMVAWARKWIGTSGYTENSSHRFGEGVTRGDCSAFVNAAIHHATGKYIDSADSWTGSQMDWLKAKHLWVGGSNAWKSADPGDVVYYSGHVALFGGHGTVISNGSDPIKEHAADYRTVLGIGRTSTLGATPAPKPAPKPPAGPFVPWQAKVLRDTQLWNSTIGTKRSPSPGGGGTVTVTGPGIDHGGKVYRPISWGGNPGGGWVDGADLQRIV